MEAHVKVLGVLYIALGALGVLGALVLLLTVGGVAGMIGATADTPDAAVALPVIGLAGSALALFLLLISLPGVIVGYGLLKFMPWARIGGLILSVLNLINFPLGTVLGVYGLWVLLTGETEQLFLRGRGTDLTPPRSTGS